MRDKKMWKSLAVWTLTLTMAMGNSGVMVMAESTDGAGWVTEDGFTDYAEEAETEDLSDFEAEAEASGFENPLDEAVTEEADEFISGEINAVNVQEEDNKESENESEENIGRRYFSTNTTFLVNEGTFIERERNYWDGESLCPVIVNNVEIKNAEDEETETPVCKINEREDGWQLEGLRSGHAIAVLSYTDHEGNARDYEMDIYVTNDNYWVEASWEDENRMSLNSENSLLVKLYHRWYYNEDDYGDEYVENFQLELNPDEDGIAYNTDFIDVTVEDGEESDTKELKIKSKDKVGGSGIRYKVIVPGENQTILEGSEWINVIHTYDKITFSTMRNIDVGEYIDFSGLKVVHIENGIETTRDDVIFKVETPDSDCWDMETAEDGSIQSMRRLLAETSGFDIGAYAENAEGELVQIDSKHFWYPWLDYSVELNCDGVFYDNGTGEITVNTDNIDGRNASIVWKFGYGTEDDEETFTEFTDNAIRFWEIEENKVVVDGKKLAAAYEWLNSPDGPGENSWIEVQMFVMAGADEESEGIQVYEIRRYLDSRKSRYNYELEKYNDRKLLVDNGFWIDRQNEGRVEDASHWGENLPFEITSVTVENAEGEEADPVCIVHTEDEESGWDVTAERPGHAILKLTYTDMLDENIIHEFEADIWVEKDLYHLNIWYEDENDAMPLKSEKIAHVSLNHQWAYSDEDCGGDEVRDFNLKVVPDEDGNLYKQDVIDVAFEKDENGNWIIKITSKDVEDWTRICVQASIKDENGNEQVVADSEFSVDVQDNLLVIEGEASKNVLVGEKFDINTCNLELVRYTNGERQVIEDAVFEIQDYDNSGWKADPDGSGIIRQVDYETWVDIGARIPGDDEEEDEYAATRSVHFDGIDYFTYFKDLREDDYATWIYEDEEYALTLEKKYLQDKNVEIQWEVGYKTNDGMDKLTPITEADYGKFWSESSEDPYSLIINGKVLKAAQEKLYKNLGEAYWFGATAHIVAKGSDIEIDRESAGFWSKDNVSEYTYPAYAVALFPGEKFILEDSFEYYEENKEHPYGNTRLLTILDVSLETTDFAGGENPVTVEKKDNHWVFTGNYLGGAKVTITYQDIDETLQKHEIKFNVIDALYYTASGEENGETMLLQGEEKTIPIEVYCMEMNSDGTYKKTLMPEGSYTLTIGDEEDSGYPEWLLDSVKVNGSSLVVKANSSNTGSEGISVNAVSVAQNNGAPIWAASGNAWVTVRKFYYTLKPASLNEQELNVGVNETLDINKYQRSLTLTEQDENGNKYTKECENVRYSLEYDITQWESVSETDGEKLPVLKRITKNPAWVCLVAEVSYVDRFGNTIWEYATQQNYYFARIMDEEECTHTWEITSKKDATCTAEGSITYTCSKCKETKTETIAKLAHNIVTVVDSQPNCSQPGKQHKECSMCHGERKDLADLPANGNHVWKETRTTAATCTAEGSKEYTCSVCKQTKTETIKKLAHNMVTVADSQPTCGQVGKQHKECSLCHGEHTALGDLPATGKHTWSAYVRTADPTAAAEGKEVRTCSVCGSKETRTIAKLAAFAKVSSTSFPMKKSQSVKLPVTLEKGDSIKSAVSSNKKKLTVSVKGNVVTLKAAKKATKGTVKVTITTTCGATQTVTVKLQGSTVQAKKIAGISKKLTLKVKKKATLKPVVTPISYQNKVTYKSSKTKVATVSKKGVITAKKAGKTTITVTCGKIKVRCTVTVKK